MTAGSQGGPKGQPHTTSAPRGLDPILAGRLLTCAPVLMGIIRDERIVYLNPAGLQLLRAGEAEVCGRIWTEILHPDDRPSSGSMLDSLAAGEAILPVKFGLGEPYTDVALGAVRLPGASGEFLIHAADITGRVRAADEMEQSENRYRYLVQNARDMICVCEDEKIVLVNAAGVRMLGAQTPSDLHGKPFAAFVHNDYRAILDEGLAGLIGEDGTTPIKMIGIDGRMIDVEFHVMHYESGRSVMVEVRDVTERVRTAETLRDREQRIRGIMDTVVDGIITIDERGVILSFNRAAERIFGYGGSEVIGQSVNRLMPQSLHQVHDGYIRNYRASGPRFMGRDRELTGQRKDGTMFPLEVALSELRHGKQRLIIGVVRDITERKLAEQALKKAHDELEQRVEERTRELTAEIAERKRAEEKLRLAATVIETTSEAVVIVDDQFTVTDVNPAFAAITGWEWSEVVGHRAKFLEVLAEEPEQLARLTKGLERKGHWEGELWNKRKTGEAYAERLSISAIVDGDGGVRQYAALISDITKRKQDEERIRYQANYDNLTGLPNRSLFQDRLAQAIEINRRRSRRLGLMFIDLDGFKLVNDTLGHDAGDLLLKEAAHRIAACVRTTDTVARLGGDEFTVILTEIDDSQNAVVIADRILESLLQPFHLTGREASVSGSIGITIFPEDADDATHLLKNADASMYRAKEQGKANYQFFTPDMNAEAEERLSLKNGLRRAVEREEFTLFYQPKMDIATQRISGVEALIRWRSPDMGLVSPGKFIPMLEETGLIVDVGLWALHTACRQHKAWLDAGFPPISIAVNLSARQLNQTGFAAKVRELLDEHGVDTKGLEMEVTESMLMSNAGKGVAELRALHDMGLAVAMDDFGTGYSSLGYLKRFPIDVIKIDRSFINDVASNPEDSQIVKTIIDMGHALGRKIVAEGVEKEDQLAVLRRYNCDQIQGYYLSPAVPGDDLASFLVKWSDRAT